MSKMILLGKKKWGWEGFKNVKKSYRAETRIKNKAGAARLQTLLLQVSLSLAPRDEDDGEREMEQLSMWFLYINQKAAMDVFARHLYLINCKSGRDLKDISS